MNEMGYASSSIAESPGILTNSLRERIIPRCSVIKIFVSKGLTEEKISLRSLGKMTYKLFLDKFVIPNEQESPALIKIIDSWREILLFAWSNEVCSWDLNFNRG